MAGPLRKLFGFFTGRRRAPERPAQAPALPLQAPVRSAPARLDMSARTFMFSEPPVPSEPAVAPEPAVPSEPRLSH